MKRFVILALCILVSALFSGCGQDSEKKPSISEAPKAYSNSAVVVPGDFQVAGGGGISIADKSGRIIGKYSSENSRLVIDSGSIVPDLTGLDTVKGYVKEIKSVEIGGTIEEIQDNAFSGCTALTEVIINAQGVKISNTAFSGCTALKYFSTASDIPDRLFTNNTSVYSLILKDGAASIGRDAFGGCTALTTVEFCSGISFIGDGAFKGCTSLSSVNITANGPLTIEGNAFDGCTAIRDVSVAASFYSTDTSAITLGRYVFNGCTNLQNGVRLGKGVTEIGDYAFNGCTGLKNLYLPGNVKTGVEYLAGTKQVEVIFEGGEDASGQGQAKSGDTGVYSISVTDYSGKNRIGTYSPDTKTLIINAGSSVPELNGLSTVREFVKDIKYVEIGGTVKEIQDDAFSGCAALTGVTITAPGIEISDTAFSGCTALRRFETASDVPARLFTNNTSIRELTLTGGASSIGRDAFSGCSALTDVDFGAAITFIGDGAFKGCTSLKQLNISTEAALTVESNAFNGCTDVREASIGATGNKTITLCSYIFSGCTNLQKVELGKGIVDIGDYAFNGCTGLKDLYLSESLKNVGVDYLAGTKQVSIHNLPSGVIFKDITVTDNRGYEIGTYSTNTNKLVISSGSAVPEVSSLNSIRDYAKDIKYVEIGGEISEIADNAFSGCTALTDVTITAQHVKISDTAFSSCTALKNFTSASDIPDRLFMNNTTVRKLALTGRASSIGRDAFSGCTGLTEVSFGNAMSSIGDGAFKGCTSLSSVSILTDSSLSIDNSAFDGCTAIRDVLIGGTENAAGDISIKLGSYIFNGCTNLQNNVYLEEGVTEIGDYAFKGCTGLKKMYLPKSLKKIGAGILSGTDGVTCYSRGNGSIENRTGYMNIAWGQKWEKPSK